MTTTSSSWLTKSVWTYAIIATIALIVLFKCSGEKIQGLTTTVTELQQRPLQSEVTYWVDKYDKEHAQVKKIALPAKNMEEYVASISRRLNIKPKQIDETALIETGIAVHVPLTTIPIKIDSSDCHKAYKIDFHNTPWMDITGKVGLGKDRDSLNITGIDTIIKTNYWKRNWFLGPKTYWSDYSNANKYIKIKGVRTVGKEVKDPVFIIAPSLQLSYPLSKELDFLKPQLTIGFSIIYYPLSIKIRR